MAWPLLFLVMTPLFVGLVCLLVRGRRLIEALQCGQAVTMVVAAAFLVDWVVGQREASVDALLRADALSAWFDLILGIVGGTGTLFAVGYLGEEYDRQQVTPKWHRLFFVQFDLYLAAMLLAVNVENVA